MFDVLIRNGTAIDGSGAPRRQADLAISGERIVAVESLPAAQSKEVIDATGLVVAPGFIDAHCHDDGVLPFQPTADSKVAQGITTEVGGNCGGSAAPLSPATREEANSPANRNSPVERAGMDVDWGSVEEYFARLTRQGMSVNLALLAGLGTIRKKVMGMTDGAPTPEQLEEMKGEVEVAMDAGAIGVSTGLIYPPSVYARTDEIIALATVAAAKGGVYASHIRGEGDTLMEAADEALTVGREAGLPVQIAHLKASGPDNWHKMPLVIERIESARADGLDVTADMYSYRASNTGLGALLPHWAHVGGAEACVERLKDPAVRRRIHDEGKHRKPGPAWAGYDERYIASIVISYCPPHPEYDGRYLHEVAAERGQDPLDAAMDILIESTLTTIIIIFSMKEENVALGLSRPWVMIGTDGASRYFEGPHTAGKPHPRNFGTFPRVLGKYCREDGLFSLEEAVRKMTSLPAGKFRLNQRGLLREGHYADIVVFDSQAVADVATFAEPRQRPRGIPWVFVNGQAAIADGRQTGARPGRVLRHGG